jgi:hypothetical protein
LPITVNKPLLVEIKLPEKILKNIEDLNDKLKENPEDEDAKKLIKENLEVLTELAKDDECEK